MILDGRKSISDAWLIFFVLTDSTTVVIRKIYMKRLLNCIQLI